ncbi:MAG: glycosyltransferase family 1 protein [Bacteroidaceae bacterium]|nr:glycosyltransferase family 1 protein [Bacteroidaceae bacterium]
MKILLIGEFSNVHWTLAQGLRALGHDVTVVSDGDRWKNYPRDVNLQRRHLGDTSRLRRMAGAMRYLCDLARIWPTLKGYDVVQLINPVFIDLKAERLWPFYQFLRRHNGRVFLGAFGIDHYWVKVGSDCKTFRYSDFNFGSQLRDYPFMHTMIRDWLQGPKGELNQRMAEDCDGIISGLYEYEMCYRPFFPDKTRFIPFPINLSSVTPVSTLTPSPSPFPAPLRFFIGIQRSRSAYKGTDLMLSALQRLQADFGPDRVAILKAESVPFAQYQEMMNSSHVLLDQLYSYTPAMNALLAMAKGLIVVGGGEEEQYELLGEHQLRPIINVQPTEQDVYDQIAKRLLSGKEDIHQLQLDSMEYIRRHHDHIKVAQSYLDFYTNPSANRQAPLPPTAE